MKKRQLPLAEMDFLDKLKKYSYIKEMPAILDTLSFYSEKKLRYNFLADFQNTIDHYQNNKSSSMALQHFVTTVLQNRYFLRLSDLFAIKQLGYINGLNLEQQMIAKKEIILKSLEQLSETIISMKNKDDMIRLYPFFEINNRSSLFNEETESKRIIFDILIAFNPITYLNDDIRTKIREIVQIIDITLPEILCYYLFQMFQEENLFFIPAELPTYELLESTFPHTKLLFKEIVDIFSLKSEIGFDKDILSIVEKAPLLQKKRITSFEEAKLYLNNDCIERINRITKELNVHISYKNIEFLHLSPNYVSEDKSMYDLVYDKISYFRKYLLDQPDEYQKALNKYSHEYLKSSTASLLSDISLLKNNPERGKNLLNDIIDKIKLSVEFLEQKNKKNLGMTKLATNLQMYIHKCDFSTYEEEEIINLTDDDKVRYFNLLMSFLEVPEKKLPTFCPESKLNQVIDNIVDRIRMENENYSKEYINNVQKLLNIYITKFSYFIKTSNHKDDLLVPFKKVKGYLINFFLNEKNYEYNDYLTFASDWRVKWFKGILTEINNQSDKSNQFFQNYGFQYVSNNQDIYSDSKINYNALFEFKELYDAFNNKFELSLASQKIQEKENNFNDKFGSQIYRELLSQSFAKDTLGMSVLLFIPNVFISFVPNFIRFLFDTKRSKEKMLIKQQLENQRNQFQKDYDDFKVKYVKKINKYLLNDYNNLLQSNQQKTEIDKNAYQQVKQVDPRIIRAKMNNLQNKDQKSIKAISYDLTGPEKRAELTFLKHLQSIIKKFPDTHFITLKERDDARVIVDVMDSRKILIAASVYAFSILSLDKSLTEILINLSTNGIINIHGTGVITLTKEGVDRVMEI
ncbi:MAG: hypothetical protein MJB14_22265 [Spirochaetes bacterium]|nr:hypothetical protein [Spirochaetota bacterium]